MIIKTRQLTSKLALLILAVLVAGTEARGDITITIEQVGNNVVETGSGSVTTSGLTVYSHFSSAFYNPQLAPQFALALVGSAFVKDDVYTLTGPASFGTGGAATFTTGTGSTFGIYGAAGQFALPSDYVSGTALSGSATFDNTNFTNLGLTAGTSYTYTLGADQYLTVQIISTAAAVPEPSTAIVAVLGVIAFVTYGWTLHRRQQRGQVSA